MNDPVRRLAGRVALITGAGRGFGREIALAFAREGADVAVNYRVSVDGASEVVRSAQELGRRASVLRAGAGTSPVRFSTRAEGG